MNKNEIKQIILEEIKAAINEMASPEELAADSRPEDDDRIARAMETGDEDELEDLAAGELDRAGLEEMARTSNVFKLGQEASLQDVLQFMQRVNDVLKTYKSPGQKRPKKRFTPEEMKALATAMLNPEGFTSKDIIANTSYNSPAQANKFLKALEMKGLITLTSQLKKSMEPTRDPDAPETRGRKRRDAEFDMSDDPMADLDALGLGGDIDLSDPLAENNNIMNKTINEISVDKVAAAVNAAIDRGEHKRADQLAQTFFRDFVGKDFGEGLGKLEKVQLKGGPQRETRGLVLDFSLDRTRVQYIVNNDRVLFTKKGGAINPIKGLPIDRRAVRNLQQIIKVVNPKSKIITGTGAFNVKGLREATNLEKYIKQQIKEAKNPLAAKMKEVEIQGRTAALETKLAAVAEMIEETEGRLTRIDEDNEFRDMMDKGAVKEVRKQLKELERAQAKLQKEYDKVSGGRKKTKVVDELDADGARDKADNLDALADKQDALDQEAEDSMEEVSFELNESTLRFQKLAGLITESDIQKKKLNEGIKSAAKQFVDFHVDGNDNEGVQQSTFSEKEYLEPGEYSKGTVEHFKELQNYLKKNKKYEYTSPGDVKYAFTLSGKNIKLKG